VDAVEAPSGSVNRTVSITVSASDDVGVTEVRFFVDGNLIGSDSSAPYSIDWDTSAEADGDHTLTAEAEDAAGNVGQSAETVVSVLNTVQFDVALDGEQEVPESGSQATGQATLTVNLASGAVEGQLTLTGLDATAAHIHDAFAGTNGGVLVPLEQDGTNPSLFTVPADAALDAAGVDRLLAGALYVNAHTAAFPGGEIRGQILPDGFLLSFTSLSGDSAGSGRWTGRRDTVARPRRLCRIERPGTRRVVAGPGGYRPLVRRGRNAQCRRARGVRGGPPLRQRAQSGQSRR
jgi:hypothetical protein